MTILGVGVLTKDGQTIVSRQTLSGDSAKLESYFSAFPKLLSASRADYNFIDSSNVRYVFHSMESLYIVLLTTISSNVLDDNEALTLISRCIKSLTHNPDPTSIKRNSLQIIYLIDECVGSGHRELASPNDIEARLSMFSLEEESIVKQREETVKKQKEFIQKQSDEALQRRLTYLSSGGDVKREFEIDGGISSESRKTLRAQAQPVVSSSATGGVSRDTMREKVEPVVASSSVAVVESKPQKQKMVLKAKKTETLI
ncbi:hypothetical protein RCL1_007679 [Eukaryota sp. TZLM3-RCL]